MAWNMEETVYENHPEGVYVAELVTFTDEGEVQTQHGLRHRGYYELQTGELREDGQPFSVRLYVYPSASERARITELRNAIAGRKLAQKERVGEFDPQSLLGQRLQVQLAHSEPTQEGKVYCNVVSMMALPRPAAPPAGATQTEAAQQQQRWNTQQQQQQQQPARQPTAQEAHPPADDGGGDLPF